jgi:hypothetical protein
MCVSRKPFNLYAESVEYWNDANMVVAVRQATVVELARILQGNASLGRTSYYFVQTADITQMRLHLPWPTSALGTSATSFESVLFSNVSTHVNGVPTANLPNVGAWVGHSLAAVVRLVGVLVNAFVNPFALTELLDARWLGVCPDNALQHSALEKCGMALLDLDDAFRDIYAASHAFWDTVVWLTNLIFPSSMPSVDILGRPLTAATLQRFLQGLAVVGDATHVETLFSAGRWVSAFDTGAERYLEQPGRRRRRLLQADGGGGGGSEDKKEKKGILGHITGGIKMGVRGFGSLTKFMLAVLTSPPFTGADFSALFSTQSPHQHMVGATVSAPPVAFAEFTYKAAMPMVLDVIASVRAGKPSVASVWQHLGTTRDLFDEIVDTRLRQACSGVRLSMGYSTQLAQSMYYACRAAADMGPTMLQVLTTVFADMTLYRCLCVNPSGEDYIAYVQTHCAAYIPPTRKGFWQVRAVFLIERVCVCVRDDDDRDTAASAAAVCQRGVGARVRVVDGARHRRPGRASAALGAVARARGQRKPGRALAVDRARRAVGAHARVRGDVPYGVGAMACDCDLRGRGVANAGGRRPRPHARRSRVRYGHTVPSVRGGGGVSDASLTPTGYPRSGRHRRRRGRARHVRDVLGGHTGADARRVRRVDRAHRGGRGRHGRRPRRAVHGHERPLRALAVQPRRHRAHSPAQRALPGLRQDDALPDPLRRAHCHF